MGGRSGLPPFFEGLYAAGLVFTIPRTPYVGSRGTRSPNGGLGSLQTFTL